MKLLHKIGAAWRRFVRWVQVGLQIIQEREGLTLLETDTSPQLYHACETVEGRETGDTAGQYTAGGPDTQDTNGQAAYPRRLDGSWDTQKDLDEINTESGDSNTEESFMAEWNTRTPRQVYRHQRGIARYWEPGTEPDILSPEFKKAFGNKKN
ncbi:uncharacterized protein ARMOST_11901 [Armillaria ostoyae]|uniref:Uncharacterized protein n=1 Tax=Armillaria ostoyae TaxID=47428 RepID=A0A284RIF5_ARMOS|nr:uncharacterized protein ARMOST_11901 [Armillaria ostoyae]